LGEILTTGFGNIDMRTMMSDNWLLTSMVGLVLLANLPQVILTFICFAYNIIFTAMLLFNEWISYVRKRKRHRISQVCKRI
jgi:hypothetical protein